MTSASMVNPRSLSAASSPFSAARYRNFTVVPYCEEPHAWVCCIWHCRWRRWSRGLKELQALAAPLWAAALALHCTTVSSHREQPWEAEPAPLCPPTAAAPVGEVMCRDASGKLQECSTWAVSEWLLAPCAAPLESQLRQHCQHCCSLREGGPRTVLRILL